MITKVITLSLVSIGIIYFFYGRFTWIRYYVVSLKRRNFREKYMEREIAKMLHSDTLIKDVKKKIIVLNNAFDLDKNIQQKLDAHLQWVLDECKVINHIHSPKKMKKQYQKLVELEKDRWNAIEGFMIFQSGM